MEGLKTSVPGEWGKVLQIIINLNLLMNRNRLCLSKHNLCIHAHWFQEQSTEYWNFRNWKSTTGFKVWPKKDVPLEFWDQPTHASLALLEASKSSQHFPGVSGTHWHGWVCCWQGERPSGRERLTEEFTGWGVISWTFLPWKMCVKVGLAKWFPVCLSCQQ